MGIFSKMLGSTGKCRCGKKVTPSDGVNMNFFTQDPNGFSIDGLGGYCRQCRQYRCSDHMKFHTDKPGATDGMYYIACADCRRAWSMDRKIVARSFRLRVKLRRTAVALAEAVSSASMTC